MPDGVADPRVFNRWFFSGGPYVVVLTADALC